MASRSDSFLAKIESFVTVKEGGCMETCYITAVNPYLVLKSIINQRTGVVERKELTAYVG